MLEPPDDAFVQEAARKRTKYERERRAVSEKVQAFYAEKFKDYKEAMASK